jgi:cytoskeletal protein RodZ
MDQLGEDLKRAREAAGLSLRDMESRTKISVTALEALERNDFSRLPGGIFGRAFVRAYATEVGEDPDEVVTRFVAVLAQSEREAAERRAARQPEITQDDRQFLERQRRAVVLLRVALVVAVVALTALAAWRIRVMLTEPEAPIEDVAPAPVAIVPPEPADPVPDRLPAAGVSGAISDVMAVEFDLVGDCWISMSIDGAAPVARLYREGEHQRIEVSSEVLLDVGNAGALRLTIDGRPARSLGGDGARVRTRITLDNRATFVESPPAAEPETD